MNKANSSEITRNGLQAIIEVRSTVTGTGNVIEVVFLSLFNKREIPLRVMVEDSKETIEPNKCLAEILVGYRTNDEAQKIPYIDTDAGQVTWDAGAHPPEVQIDPTRTLT